MNRSEQIIKQHFQEYYAESSTDFYVPPNPEEREYGFLLFKEKFMVRHRGFKTSETLLSAIRDLVPAHVYFSTAHYEEPAALSMQEKGWKNADLVFDIDADHLETPCKKEHDSWKCKGCQTIGLGTTPKVCPKCKNDRFEEQTWLCEKCLHQAKEETTKLLDILETDFGIDPSQIRIFFSGHRGYHVHVYTEQYCQMGEEERREIADYMLGLGLDPGLHELDELNVGGVKVLEGPELGQPGWRGRIVSGMYNVLSTAKNPEQLGFSKTQAAAITSLDRESLFKKPFWNTAKGVGLATWKMLASKGVAMQASQIDTVVTTDVHRLIRLPGTLNGHTGLLATRVSNENLDEFDPFVQSIAFTKGTLRLTVKNSPRFTLMDKNYGPYNNEKIELPTSAGILLLCKHRAEPSS